MRAEETSEALRARVSQLAGVLGMSPDDVLPNLALDETATATSWVPPEVVNRTLEAHTPRKDPAELRSSVQAAFSAARESREDWQSMPLPVLKNRLLALTGGAFHEWDYGWPNLRFLPRAYPDLLELDASTPHGAATYIASPTVIALPDIDQPSPEAPSSRAVGRRIREDLWNAVVDYRSGLNYIWDARLERAVGIDGPVGASELTFPTIDSDEVHKWRTECAQKWLFLNGDADRESIQAWVDHPRSQVPQRFIETWRSDQRERVAALIEHFFEGQGAAVPTDAFPSARPPVRAELTARELVLAAAQVMTDSELDSLQLPVRVILRALQHGGHAR